MTPRTVGAFTIPKGDIVGVCTPTCNRDERLWTNPEKFDPKRFLQTEPKGADAAAWSAKTVEHGQTPMMLSFGGGHHMCTGRRFGFLQAPPPMPTHLRHPIHWPARFLPPQVSTIWSILLRDFDLEMIGPVRNPRQPPPPSQAWPAS